MHQKKISLRQRVSDGFFIVRIFLLLTFAWAMSGGQIWANEADHDE